MEAMEAILGVDREVQIVLDKLARFSSREAAQVAEAATQLREARQELQQGEGGGGRVLSS